MPECRSTFGLELSTKNLQKNYNAITVHPPAEGMVCYVVKYLISVLARGKKYLSQSLYSSVCEQFIMSIPSG